MPVPNASPYRRAALVCVTCGNEMRLKLLDPNQPKHKTAFATFFCDSCRYGIEDVLPHADGNFVPYEPIAEANPKRLTKKAGARK